jgi:hypothetical protein
MGEVGRELRSKGAKSCVWFLGGWRSRGSRVKPGQQSGGLGLANAWQGQSWYTDKGSVHGPMWPSVEPALQSWELPMAFHRADEGFRWKLSFLFSDHHNLTTSPLSFPRPAQSALLRARITIGSLSCVWASRHWWFILSCWWASVNWLAVFHFLLFPVKKKVKLSPCWTN